MPHVHPLELPEIIERVGYFLPLWDQTLSDHTCRLETVLKPKTFHACLLVSKLWRQTLLPILWTLYDAEGMSHIPKDTLTRYSPFFRTFYMQQGQIVSNYCCTQLTSATLNPGIADLDQLRQILYTNRGLKSLEWNGPVGSELLAIDDFTHLTQLEILSLSHWDISAGRLGQALAPLAGSLRKLDLGWLKGTNGRDTWNQDDDESGQDVQAMEHDSNNLGDCPILPLVETFRAIGPPYSVDPTWIVKRCPNLSRLDLTLLRNNNEEDGKEDHIISMRLADSLRSHCPNLRALALRGSIGQEHKMTIVRNCTAAAAADNGLSELILVLRSVNKDLLDFIAPHALTLETLGILNSTDEDASMEHLFRMPVVCPRLKWFSVAAWSCWEVKGQDAVNALKVSTWRCRDLEILDVDIQEPDPDSGLDGDMPPAGSRNDSIRMGKLFKDGPILGWHYHPENDGDGDRPSLSEAVVRGLFEAVKELEKLRLVRWSGMIFTRSSSRASAEFDGMPFIYVDY
ncbi:hypothetical protein BGZ95_008934 [Linnemannia exigua]|uniref:F-box domain-containing protein n=1 Tax=Linnemannia exigua TaxID=604196 RepID=A0AAD4DF98_9FUNG|nr:hypothetical protein BGZ95_008934 [Linnemannia exigua]